MNTWECTDGERVTQVQIKYRMDKTKQLIIDQMILDWGYSFCSKCKRSDKKPLDCAHDVSIDKAKKMGKTELCWQESNINLLCRGCHQVKDGLNLQFSK